MLNKRKIVHWYLLIRLENAIIFELNCMIGIRYCQSVSQEWRATNLRVCNALSRESESLTLTVVRGHRMYVSRFRFYYK